MEYLQEIFSPSPRGCSFRERQFLSEVKVAAAHAAMLRACGMLPEEDCDLALKALAAIEKENCFAETCKGDLHAALLKELVQRAGEAGERMLAGFSRGDAAATVLRMCVKEGAERAADLLKETCELLLSCAKESVRYVMPKTLSPKRAVPVNCGQYFCSYAEMLLRDIRRLCECRSRADVLPLGSGELVGTSFPLDRELARKLLRFHSLSENAMDAVTDRDFAAEYLFCVSLASEHLGRLQQELLLASSPAYNFWELPPSGGPAAEPAESRHGRRAGALSALSSCGAEQIGRAERMFFPAAEECIALLRGLVFHAVAMFDVAGKCCVAEGDVADYLVKKGARPAEAEKIAASLVAKCRKNKKALFELTFSDFKAESPLFERDILAAVTTRVCVESRGSGGGSSTEAARKELLSLRKKLRQY